jgi:hypothetical protein
MIKDRSTPNPVGIESRLKTLIQASRYPNTATKVKPIVQKNNKILDEIINIKTFRTCVLGQGFIGVSELSSHI